MTQNQNTIQRQKAKYAVMTVKEVAVCYYPTYSPRYASQKFRRDIEEYPELKKALEAHDWQMNKRSFFPAHLELLKQYLGAWDV